jgi:hypothetical protein
MVKIVIYQIVMGRIAPFFWNIPGLDALPDLITKE